MRIQHNGAWINVNEQPINPWDVQQRQKNIAAGTNPFSRTFPGLPLVKPIFSEASGAEPPYTWTTCPAESSPGDRRDLARPARIQTRTSDPLHELHVQIEDIQEILRHFDVKVTRDSYIVIKSDSTQTALNKVNDEV